MTGFGVMDFEFGLKFLDKTLSMKGKSRISNQEFEFGQGEG